jgi:diguanylate cyclase (GGDEF)-like protein
MSENRTALLDFIDKIEQLIQFQNKIDTPSSIDQIWSVFLADIRHLITIDVCALFLVDEQTYEFVLKDVFPADKAAICRKEIESQIECGMFSSIIKRGQPAVIPSLIFKNQNTTIMLPLATIRRTLGVVLALTPVTESSITQEDIKLLTMLTRQCSLVLENTILYDNLKREHESLENANKEIRRLSITDPLTGIFNRRYLTDHLFDEVKRARRYKHHLSLILCDIDHFKKVNDTYGHQVGDIVLQKFTSWINDMIRSGVDWQARYGGEEFVVVLPETEIGGAKLLAERLRQNIKQKLVQALGQEFRITASFGVTGFGPHDAENIPSPEALINIADKFLYQAKKQGRDQVISGVF